LDHFENRPHEGDSAISVGALGPRSNSFSASSPLAPSQRPAEFDLVADDRDEAGIVPRLLDEVPRARASLHREFDVAHAVMTTTGSALSSP